MAAASSAEQAPSGQRQGQGPKCLNCAARCAARIAYEPAALVPCGSGLPPRRPASVGATGWPLATRGGLSSRLLSIQPHTPPQPERPNPPPHFLPHSPSFHARDGRLKPQGTSHAFSLHLARVEVSHLRRRIGAAKHIDGAPQCRHAVCKAAPGLPDAPDALQREGAVLLGGMKQPPRVAVEGCARLARSQPAKQDELCAAR
eukprot:scaffold22025_cov122-Isochrysis_galbana.AAC.3